MRGNRGLCTVVGYGLSSLMMYKWPCPNRPPDHFRTPFPNFWSTYKLNADELPYKDTRAKVVQAKCRPRQHIALDDSQSFAAPPFDAGSNGQALEVAARRYVTETWDNYLARLARPTDTQIARREENCCQMKPRGWDSGVRVTVQISLEIETVWRDGSAYPFWNQI
jgi:hypothetical protein